MKSGLKTGTIVAIVCWSIAALIILSMLITALTGGFTGFNVFGFGIGVSDFGGGTYSVMEKYEVDANDIDSINIDWTSGKVNVEPYDGDKIYFEESAKRTLEDKHKLTYEINGSALNIKYLEGFIFWNVPNKRIDMKVPKDLAAKMSNLSVSGASADITVTEMSGQRAKMHSVSGTIDLTSVKFDDLNMESTSGNIKTAEADALKCSASSVSGDMYLLGNIADLNASTTSGRIETTSANMKYFSGSSVSGDVKMASKITPENVNINTTSGSGYIEIPESGGFTAKFSSVSGTLRCDFPVTTNDKDSVYKDGAAKFSISTVSGDGHIIKA